MRSEEFSLDDALGPDDLREIGELLYGVSWREHFQVMLGLPSPYLLDLWAKGDHPIPAIVWESLLKLVEQKRAHIDGIVNKFQVELSESMTS